MPLPTLYELEPIGVNGQLEAVAALHFCSEGCRSAYRRHPAQRYSEGIEPRLEIDGEVCEQCHKPLQADTTADAREG